MNQGLFLGGAQVIGLSQSERRKLAQIVTTDPEAQKLFNKLERDADVASAAKGNPVERLATGSRLDSDPAKIASRASLQDMKRLQALGYAYAISPHERYAEAGKRIILAWASKNQPTGLPVDETKLEPAFVAYDLFKDTFTQSERLCVEKWLRTIAELEQQTGRRDSVTTSNNWQSHRLKIVGLIGFLLSDKELIDTAVAGYKKQIELNLRPDGSSFDFLERDALHYHCYTLEPLLTLALAAQRNGIELYSFQASNGNSLAKSVAFLVPYCRGEKTHAEWVHSRVRFDAIRAANGEEKFVPGKLFQPGEACRVFELASYFDCSYEPLVLQFSRPSAKNFPTWQTVLNKVYQ